jgi:hypothetical protein
MRLFHILIVAVAILFWLQSPQGRKTQREVGVMAEQQTSSLLRPEV